MRLLLLTVGFAATRKKFTNSLSFSSNSFPNLLNLCCSLCISFKDNKDHMLSHLQMNYCCSNIFFKLVSVKVGMAYYSEKIKEKNKQTH